MGKSIDKTITNKSFFISNISFYFFAHFLFREAPKTPKLFIGTIAPQNMNEPLSNQKAANPHSI
jgi:hypothetical protein